MMSDDEIIAVVQAHKEGKDIQFKLRGSEKAEWCPSLVPIWNFNDYCYRVKPESPPLESCNHQWEKWRYGWYRCSRCFWFARSPDSPEPRKPREWTVGLTGDGQIVSWRTSLAECNSTIRVREVIDD